MEKEMSVNMAQEEAKLPKFRKMYLAALACLLNSVAVGIATGYSAPATYDMTTRTSSRIKPTKDQISWIGSVLPLGIMVGSVFGGPLADKLGRKDIIIWNIIPTVSSWFMICYAESVATVIVGRLFSGFSCGIVCVVVPMYCVEISTTDVRGLLGSAFQLSLTVGTLLSVVIGSYVTWEYLAVAGAVFATIGLISFCPMPESPRWLISKNQMQRAVRNMHSLQGRYVNAEEECNAIYNDMQNQFNGKLSLQEFLHPTIYKPILIAVTLMLLQQFSGINALFFYSSHIFEISKSILNPKTSTAILGAVQVVVTLLSTLIVDKAGRKILLIISGGFCVLFHTILGIYYYLSSGNKDFQNNYAWIPLVNINLFVTAFSIGYGAIPWFLAAEMVPIRARSISCSAVNLSCSLSGFIVTKTFTGLEDLIGTYGVFWIYGFITLVGIMFVWFVVPETKGRRLESISKVFNNNKASDKRKKEIAVACILEK